MAERQMLTIRGTVDRAKADGLPISEYSLRLWVQRGEIPCRRAGRTMLLYYPNVRRYLTFEDVPPQGEVVRHG